MQTGTHTQSAPHFDPDLLKPVGLAPPSTAVQKAAKAAEKKKLKSELISTRRELASLLRHESYLEALQAQLDAA
jgi:hypothetical protein